MYCIQAIPTSAANLGVIIQVIPDLLLRLGQDQLAFAFIAWNSERLSNSYNPDEMFRFDNIIPNISTCQLADRSSRNIVDEVLNLVRVGKLPLYYTVTLIMIKIRLYIHF